LYAGQALFEKGKGSYDSALEYFFLAYRSLENTTITTKVEPRSQSLDDPQDKGYNVQLILTSAIESIGNAYKELGRHNEAIRFYHEALTMLASKTGRKSHDVARLYYILAQSLSEQNDYIQSLEMFNLAKDVFSSIYGDQHPETAACYYRIGLVLRQVPKRNVEALESLQKARDRWLKEFGADHANVIEVEKCIGELEQQFDSGIGLPSC
jgi:tetratricopeptide (TPR) repeat protein